MFIWSLFHFLYWWAAILLLVYLVSKFLNYIVQISVFRGCSFWHRKDFEGRVEEYLCKVMIKSLSNLESLVAQFAKDNRSDLLATIEQIGKVKED